MRLDRQVWLDMAARAIACSDTIGPVQSMDVHHLESTLAAHLTAEAGSTNSTRTLLQLQDAANSHEPALPQASVPASIPHSVPSDLLTHSACLIAAEAPAIHLSSTQQRARMLPQRHQPMAVQTGAETTHKHGLVLPAAQEPGEEDDLDEDCQWKDVASQLPSIPSALARPWNAALQSSVRTRMLDSSGEAGSRERDIEPLHPSNDDSSSCRDTSEEILAAPRSGGSLIGTLKENHFETRGSMLGGKGCTDCKTIEDGMSADCVSAVPTSRVAACSEVPSDTTSFGLPTPPPSHVATGPSLAVGPFIVDELSGAHIPTHSDVVLLKERRERATSAPTQSVLADALGIATLFGELTAMMKAQPTSRSSASHLRGGNLHSPLRSSQASHRTGGGNVDVATVRHADTPHSCSVQ